MSAGAHVTVIADHVTSLWWRIILKEKPDLIKIREKLFTFKNDVSEKTCQKWEKVKFVDILK